MSITAGRLHIYSKPHFGVVVFDFSQAVWLNDHAVVVVYSGTNFGGDAVCWQHCGFGTKVAAEAESEFNHHEKARTRSDGTDLEGYRREFGNKRTVGN